MASGNKRFESKVFTSSALENDSELHAAMREIEDQVRNGYGGNRGAFEKEDLIFLKEREHLERLHEQDLADHELSEFASLRSRADDLDLPVRVATKPKAEIKAPSKLLPSIKVAPKPNIRVIAKDSTKKASTPSPVGGEPAVKKQKSTVESTGGTSGIREASGSSAVVSKVSAGDKAGVEKAVEAAEEEGGLAGLLGYSASDEDIDEEDGKGDRTNVS